MFSLETDLNNLELFFQIFERDHDPVDTASNILKKFGELESPAFISKCKNVFMVTMNLEEFVISMFMFLTMQWKYYKKDNEDWGDKLFSRFESILKVMRVLSISFNF